mmetsp:Transcript_26258/g.60343  ORF Transcript_26258/g.60343 Transcript_26258/m.60343 type:complete len:261 (+) Transcript_26258:478-1260(+)
MALIIDKWETPLWMNMENNNGILVACLWDWRMTSTGCPSCRFICVPISPKPLRPRKMISRHPCMVEINPSSSGRSESVVCTARTLIQPNVGSSQHLTPARLVEFTIRFSKCFDFIWTVAKPFRLKFAVELNSFVRHAAVAVGASNIGWILPSVWGLWTPPMEFSLDATPTVPFPLCPGRPSTTRKAARRSSKPRLKRKRSAKTRKRPNNKPRPRKPLPKLANTNDQHNHPWTRALLFIPKTSLSLRITCISPWSSLPLAH